MSKSEIKWPGYYLTLKRLLMRHRIRNLATIFKSCIKSYHSLQLCHSFCSDFCQFIVSHFSEKYCKYMGKRDLRTVQFLLCTKYVYTVHVQTLLNLIFVTLNLRFPSCSFLFEHNSFNRVTWKKLLYLDLSYLLWIPPNVFMNIIFGHIQIWWKVFCALSVYISMNFLP